MPVAVDPGDRMRNPPLVFNQNLGSGHGKNKDFTPRRKAAINAAAAG